MSATPPPRYHDLDHAMWTTAIVAGLRRRRALLLRWRDVYYGTLRIRVRQDYASVFGFLEAAVSNLGRIFEVEWSGC